MSAASRLEGELAAYSPSELGELRDTIGVLLNTASDGTAAYVAKRARIEHTLMRAVEKRLTAEMRVGRTAIVIPFPARAQ